MFTKTITFFALNFIFCVTLQLETGGYSIVHGCWSAGFGSCQPCDYCELRGALSAGYPLHQGNQAKN